MKKKQKHLKQLMAVFLAASMLAGCGSSSKEETGDVNVQVKPGQTISEDSKWVNSDIVGAIDETTATNIKDDFYTAVNKDWLLENKATKENSSVSSFTEAIDIVEDRKMTILNEAIAREEISGENDIEMSEEQFAHNQELLAVFSELAGNWDERNINGITPAQQYIKAIEDIKDMDEMTSYIIDENHTKFTNISLVPFSVDKQLQNREKSTVFIGTAVPLVLKTQDEYKKITAVGKTYKTYVELQVKYLLGRLGYSESEIKEVLKKCYAFEISLTDNMDSSSKQNSIDYLKEADNAYMLEEIKEIEGNYPLSKLLEINDMGQSNSYTVLEPDYVKAVGKLYQEKNLEEIKSYYIVHTVESMMPLLDREAYDELIEIAQTVGIQEKDETTIQPDTDTEVEKTEEEKEKELLLNTYIAGYMPEVMDEIYVANYCSKEEKQKITDVIQDTLTYYRQMLLDENWLLEETRNYAVEKLDNITIRAVYPERCTDYSNLELNQYGTLLDAVKRLEQFKVVSSASMLSEENTLLDWNMSVMSTTQVNAYYSPTDNSINIMAGILSHEAFYSEDQTIEEMYAGIGTVIGHEITHAFDTTGAMFDKDGRKLSWWGVDLVEFGKRSAKLGNYYAAMTPYPGAFSYAANVTGEAIADMGGVKSMLGLAKEKKNFDYDVFFRSYASLWRQSNLYYVEKALASDVHPLGFLRANVTLQQFDEFLETYEIEPGDGMYLAPENRIVIW